jgi:LuxR family maltose regulon positive regulatory protein
MPTQTSIAKITRPALADIYPRRRLFRLLDAGRKRHVTWVSGPAGSGKTTLVASWIESRKLPCLWYQIDEGDNDIATFFYYLGLAGKKAAPRHRTPLPLLTPEYLLDVPTFSKRYFENLCSRLQTPLILVLDNYQLIPAASPFHEILQAGLSAIPHGIHVIVISRAEPPPAYTRMLAGNALNVVGWDDLRLTPEESRGIARLLDNARQRRDLISWIHERTDGWAAGLILFIKALGRDAVEPQTLPSLPPEKIFDYFANELFQKIDGETRDFLLKTSVLPKITPSIAEQLTGNRNAARILSELNRRNYFTARRRLEGDTYEYHPLFREFLVEHARQAYSQTEFQEIQKQAAGLLLQSGQIEESAGLFIQSEDWENVSLIVLTHARHFLSQGRGHTITQWLTLIPEVIRERNAWLAYWFGISKMIVDLHESRKHLERAFGIFKDRKDVPGIYLSWCGVVDTFVYEWANFKPLDHWIEEIDALQQQYPVFPSPEIEARLTYGIFSALMWRQPQHPDISKWAERAMAIALGDGDIRLRTFISSNLILYYSWWRGETAKASLLVNNLREHTRYTNIDPLTRIVWMATAAANAFATGENEYCLSLVKSGLDLGQATGIHLCDFLLLTNGFFVALNVGDIKSADHYLQKSSFITHTGRKGDIFAYHMQMGWRSLCEGRFSAALEHEQTALKIQQEGGASPLGAAAMLQGIAEALIELGDYAAARRHLDEAAEIGVSMKSKTLKDQDSWLNAFYYLKQGERSKALDGLRNHLAISKEISMMNHLQWRPGNKLELYSLALEEGIEVEHVQKLIRSHRLVPTEAQMHLDNWPWLLKIYTFGEFKLLRDDKPLRYSRKAPKKPLELLRVIVALGGRNLSEQRLMDALWPDAEGDSGRNALSVTLSRLRELLGVKDAVQVSEGTISLDDRFVWTDVWAFERLIRAAERETEKREDLEKAIGLYHAHFLEGESASWAISPRERLRESFLRSIESLGKYWEQNREWQKAVEVYRKGVHADDLNEKCYLRQVSCLLKLGSRAEALSVYRRLKKTLNGYGVEPSAEAEELHRKIISSSREH